MKTRNLQIEATGDFCCGKITPKIRLVGQWLERAGFKPGHRVEVQISQPGILTLRFLGKNERPAMPIPDTQAGGPDIPQCPSATAHGHWQGVFELGQAILPQHGTKPVRNEIRGQQGDRQNIHSDKQLSKK
jgi:hypothetical protein